MDDDPRHPLLRPGSAQIAPSIQEGILWLKVHHVAQKDRMQGLLDQYPSHPP
jgi:hypothetical protein